MGKRSQREGQKRERVVWLALSLGQLGQMWIETTIRACPCLSVATQNLLKFGPGLGRAGPHGPSVLHLGLRVGTRFYQEGRTRTFCVPALEMP
jgi:hypothetical protein